MEAEHLRALLRGEFVANVLNVSVDRAVGGGVVVAARGELVSVVEDVRREELIEHCHETAPVPIVGDPSAVVAVSGEVREGLVRDLLLLVEEHLKLLYADAHVRVVELIRTVPAQGAEAAALLHERVEEAQSEEQLAELLRLVVAAVEELEVRDGLGEVRAEQVAAQTLRGLLHELDAVLQDRYREPVTGHRRQPQTVVQVQVAAHILLAVVLYNRREVRHEVAEQVTVLQENPVAGDLALLDELPRGDVLALAERELVAALRHLLGLGDGVKLSSGVCTGRQHKNDGHPGARRRLHLIVDVFELEERWLRVFRRHFVSDVHEHRVDDLVKTKAPHHNQPAHA
eukprot:PhM_4_TR18477/c0_g1_i1/m.21224